MINATCIFGKCFSFYHNSRIWRCFSNLRMASLDLFNFHIQIFHLTQYNKYCYPHVDLDISCCPRRFQYLVFFQYKLVSSVFHEWTSLKKCGQKPWSSLNLLANNCLQKKQKLNTIKPSNVFRSNSLLPDSFERTLTPGKTDLWAFITRKKSHAILV